MNPLEERLSRLETRVTWYRNFNVLLCLLLIAVVTVAAKEGVSPFQTKTVTETTAMAQGEYGVQESPDRNVPELLYPDETFAGKVPAQVEGTIRTRRLEIVNGDGQTVILLATSTDGDGLIFVNSPEDNNLVYIGPSALNGNGLVHINSAQGKNLIGLGSNPETNDGFIHIRNRNEEGLISLQTGQSNGWIRVDKTGNENLAYLGANTSGHGFLSLSNKSGKGLVAMFADETSGGLELSNKDDKRIAFLGTDIGGEGLLKINSKTGTELITAGSNVEDNGLFRVSNRYGTLGFFVIGSDAHGYAAIQDNQERLLADLTATASGNGLVRTLSRQGITTWSSASVQGTTVSTSLRGDMDDDGDIDGDDFLIFSENFGKKK